MGSNKMKAMCNEYNSGKFKWGIKNADVILVELGENDLTAFCFGDKLSDVITLITKTISDVTGLATKQELIDLKAALTEMQKTGTVTPENACTVVTNLSKLTKSCGDIVQAVIKGLYDTIGTSMIDHRYYWNKMMNYIDKNKKPGALVICTTYPDPTKNAEILIDAIGDMLGEYMQMNMDIDFTQIINLFVKDMNNYLLLKADDYDYKVANINGVSYNNGLEYIDWNTWDVVEGATEEQKMSISLIHPNAEGHKQIEKAIEKVYYKTINAYIPKVHSTCECEHAKTTLVNVAESTYLENGYTGDLKCTKCGKIVTAGEKLDKLVVAPTVIKSLKKLKKGFTVNWKKATDISGYEIEYCKSAKFDKNNKTVTVKNIDKASKTIKKLKCKTKYYVRVRTYLSVEKADGTMENVYSEWSASKAVTTK